MDKVEFREELKWWRSNPRAAFHWWFRRLVTAHLNGEHRAAKAYERRMRMTPADIEASRRAAQEAKLPRHTITLDQHLEGWAPEDLQAHLIHHHKLSSHTLPYDGPLNEIHRLCHARRSDEEQG
jgi:hypothetical protein